MITKEIKKHTEKKVGVERYKKRMFREYKKNNYQQEDKTFFEKKITIDEAIREIKKNTRRFAKRQLTWFKKDPSTYWFDFETDTSKILKKIEDVI